MYRRGHVGMAMLAYAPVAYLLLRERQVALAVLGLLGVLWIEPLPDSDHWIPGLRHRGASHSLVCALLVGGVLGALGWVVGDRIAVLLAGVLAGLDTKTVGIFAGPFQWIPAQFRALDARTLATLGFAMGVYGILVHLLADVITVSGIRPLLPLSNWRLSLSSIRAENSLANNGLFGLGALALVVVLYATAPAVGFAAGPGNLAPVDIAAGQTQNDSTNATVEFANQTTNGSVVTVERVTLPTNGFVVLDSTGPGEESNLEGDTIAVSKRLSAGTHRNVSIRVNRSPPGEVNNQTALTSTGTYEAVLYQDSNNNSRFEYFASGRSEDPPFAVGSGSGADLASDSARIVVRGTRGGPGGTPTPTASIRFGDQHTNGSVVVVRSVTLPDGGFVVVHNQSYLRPGTDPLRSAIGLSGYLSPGTHRNVTVALLNGTVVRPQPLVAIPSRDTNANQRYDYIRSDGFQDVPYRVGNGSVTAIANVTLSGGEQSTTGPSTLSQSTTTTTVTVTAPSNRSMTAPSTTTTVSASSPTPANPVAGRETTQPASAKANGTEGGGSALFSGIGLVIAALALAAVGYLVVRYRP